MANEKYKELMAQAAPRTKWWIADAISDIELGGKDRLDDAADDFVRANSADLGRKGACQLANELCEAMGQEGIYAVKWC